MSMLKAFIGHSFTEDDKILNNTFLEYFNVIKEMDIGFTWDHARAAEPKELAEKVMSLIRDKNLFVGICTKKERVIGSDKIKPCWIKRKILKVHESEFNWKTSDWIIQEIGLAVGRKMALILLIEEGLRLPGGLQGNIEHIEFNRQSPERSFIQILEMIRALIPKAPNAPMQELGAASSENVTQEEGKKENDNWWLEPKPEWNNNHFWFALINSIEAGNTKAEKKITAAFLESPDGRSPSGPVSWEAISLYIRLLSGKSESLSKMEQLVNDNPEVGKVQFYLGKAYAHYKEYEKAGQAYKCAGEHATGIEDRLNDLGEAAIAYCRGGIKLKSEEIVAIMKQEVCQSDAGEKNLITTLQEIANIESDMDVYYGLSERLLEIKPSDTNIRFNLAYKYSQGNEEKLSLFHYLRIPEPERSGIAWNNLGVQYNHFQMACSAINSYRKAEKIGETLAMSNIANKFIDVGFLSEAEDICSKAIKIESNHKNINLAMARIQEKPDEEIKNEEGIVKETASYSEFFKIYGRALCKTNPNDYSEIWEGPKCQLCLKIQGNHFVAEGTYEVPNNRIRDLWPSLALGAKATPPLSKKYIVKYVGTLSGYSIKAVMTEEVVNNEIAVASKTLVTGLADRTERNILMVILDSFNEIRVYDKKEPESKKLYVLKNLKDILLGD